MREIIEKAQMKFGHNIRQNRLGALKVQSSSYEFSVLLCGEQKIRQLNRDYRHKDKVTDVLSFPTFPSLLKTNSQFKNFEHLPMGDVVICLRQCERQARTMGKSFESEFIDLLCHGFLHLLGYDHELSENEHKLMFKLQDKLWKQLIAE